MSHVDKLRISTVGDVVIVLYNDGIEVGRRAFAKTIEGNGEQFRYIKEHTSKGNDFTFKRL